MYVINDCSLSNIDTMLNKNIIKCFADEELVELDHNIIDDMIDKKKNVANPLNMKVKEEIPKYKYVRKNTKKP